MAEGGLLPPIVISILVNEEEADTALAEFQARVDEIAGSIDASTTDITASFDAQAVAAAKAAEASTAAAVDQAGAYARVAEAADVSAGDVRGAADAQIASADRAAEAAAAAADAQVAAQARMAEAANASSADQVAASDALIAKDGELDAANESVLGSAKGLAGGLGKELLAALGIGYGIDKAVEAWDSFDKAQVALQTAIKNSGASLDAFTPKIKAAEAAGQNLGFNNAQVAQSLQQLTTSTNSPTRALQQLGEAEDLARIKNIDLATATLTLTRLNAGSTRALTQLGINLDIGSGKLSSIRTATEAVATAQTALVNVQNEVSSGSLTGVSAANELASAHQKLSIAERNLKIDQQTLATITDTLNARLHGAAQAFAGTLPGQIAIFKANLDDAARSAGKVLVPALDDLIKGAERVGGDLVTAGKAVGDFLNMLGPLKPLLEALAIGFAGVTAANIAWNAVAALNPWAEAALGIAAMSVAIVELVKHWQDAWQGIESVSQAVANVVINNVIDPIISAIDALISKYNAFFGWLTGNIGKLNQLGDISITGKQTQAQQQKTLDSTVEKWLKSPLGKPLNLPGDTHSAEQRRAQIDQIKAEAERTQKLVDAHKKAMQALADRLITEQQAHDIASLNLQATEETAQTKVMTDAAAAQVTIVKDQQALVSQAMQAAAKNISDMASIVSARMTAAATAITDASTVRTDQSSAIVTGMQDATQTQADILGERLLYGYQLQAQRDQVQLDVLKAGFDQLIAKQQEQVDETKQHWDGKIAAATIDVARVTQHQDQLVAIAQQRETLVQLHEDTLLRNATEAADTSALAAAVKVALAQTAVTLSATASPKQVAAASQALTLAQSQAGVSTAGAAGALARVTDSANAAITNSAGVYQKAQDTAGIQIAKVNANLVKQQGLAGIAEAKTQAALQHLTSEAAKQEQKLQDLVTLTQAGGGRRIRSDANALAYSGGGGGPLAVGPETSYRGGRERGGGGLTVNGGIHINGMGKANSEIVNEWYLTTRSLLTAPPL